MYLDLYNLISNIIIVKYRNVYYCGITMIFYMNYNKGQGKLRDYCK